MREQFQFNRRERNGVFVLLILVVCTQVLQAYMKFVKPIPRPQITYLELPDFKESIEKPEVELKAIANDGPEQIIPVKHTNTKPKKPEKRAAKLLVKLPKTEYDTTRYPESKKVMRELVRVDINAAGVKRLQQVKGIGPVLSKRIVKYRRLIGGFHSVDQLEEVYGIDKEVLDGFRKQLWFNKTELNRINVFTASVDSLASHFYVSERSANTIKAYINSIDKDEVTAEEILSLDGVWYEATKKAIPYLILTKNHQD